MQIHFKNYLQDAILGAENIPVSQNVYSLKVPHLSETFTQINSYPTLPYISIDLQSAKDIRSCVVNIGNLTSDTVVTLIGSNNSDYSSPVTNTMIYAETCFYWASNTAINKRYWKITFSKPGLSNIVISTVHIGDYLNMPGIDQGAKLTYNTTSSRDLSISGQVYGDLGYQYLDTSFDFPTIPETNWVRGGKTIASRKDIINMWNTVQNSTPVWLFIWENSLAQHAPVFCVLNQSSIEFTKSEILYSTSLNFLEVK